MLLTLAGCVSPVDSSNSAQVTKQTEPGQSESTRPTGTSGYLPGTYLPEHCDGVDPGAIPVFETLISELDAENCVAPYTSQINMVGAEVVTAESAGPTCLVSRSTFGSIGYSKKFRQLVNLGSGVNGLAMTHIMPDPLIQSKVACLCRQDGKKLLPEIHGFCGNPSLQRH